MIFLASGSTTVPLRTRTTRTGPLPQENGNRIHQPLVVVIDELILRLQRRARGAVLSSQKSIAPSTSFRVRAHATASGSISLMLDRIMLIASKGATEANPSLLLPPLEGIVIAATARAAREVRAAPEGALTALTALVDLRVHARVPAVPLEVPRALVVPVAQGTPRAPAVHAVPVARGVPVVSGSRKGRRNAAPGTRPSTPRGGGSKSGKRSRSGSRDKINKPCFQFQKDDKCEYGSIRKFLHEGRAAASPRKKSPKSPKGGKSKKGRK